MRICSERSLLGGCPQSHEIWPAPSGPALVKPELPPDRADLLVEPMEDHLRTGTTDQMKTSSTVDWARRPISIAIWWVMPVVVGNVADHLPLSQGLTALVWAAALVWMGLGCLLNARRCHRRHCYVSGPVLLSGAVVVALLGWGVVTLGPNGLSLTLWTTFGLVLLSFLPELIWGKYAGS
jgi:hypothetical protein